MRLLKLYWKRAFTLYEKLQDILGGTAYRAEEQITIMANEDGTKTPVMGLILRYVSIENGFGDDKFPQIPENIRQLIRKKIDSSVGAEKEVAEQKIKSYGLCYDYLKSIQSKISALAFIEGLEISLPILPVFNEYCYAELDMFGNVKSATQPEAIQTEAPEKRKPRTAKTKELPNEIQQSHLIWFLHEMDLQNEYRPAELLKKLSKFFKNKEGNPFILQAFASALSQGKPAKAPTKNIHKTKLKIRELLQ